MSGIASVFFLLTAVVLVSGPVRGSDVNWGKKVGCFVVEETVVCPGCNYRAGLSCPRRLKDSQNCLLPSTKSAQTTVPPPTTPEGKTTIEETTETSYEELNTTEKILLDYNETSLEANEIQRESTKNPLDMAIYLYRVLNSERRQYYRSKRELQQREEEEEEAEICNWNGDCPCPLICCKTGPGCPKRCVMGIRLPPPWG